MTDDAPDDIMDDLEELDDVLADQDEVGVETVATDRDEPSEGSIAREESNAGQPDAASELAGAIQSGKIEVDLGGETDRAALESFVQAAEGGEFGPTDPGLEATVLIVQAILNADEAGGFGL